MAVVGHRAQLRRLLLRDEPLESTTHPSGQPRSTSCRPQPVRISMFITCFTAIICGCAAGREPYLWQPGLQGMRRGFRHDGLDGRCTEQYANKRSAAVLGPMPANRLPGAAKELLPKDGVAGRFSACTQAILGKRTRPHRGGESLRTPSGRLEMTQAIAVAGGQQARTRGVGAHRLKTLRIVGGFLDGRYA